MRILIGFILITLLLFIYALFGICIIADEMSVNPIEKNYDITEE